jgi:hypothetical protein
VVWDREGEEGMIEGYTDYRGKVREGRKEGK